MSALRDFHGDNMQDRLRETALLPLEPAELDAFSIASRLWSLLDEMHRDMNSLTRTNPHALLSDTQIEVINAVLQPIIRLLGASDYAQGLRLLARHKQITTGDALMILGLYKGTLRSYRVTALGEGQYSF